MKCCLPWYPLTPSTYYDGMSYYEDLCRLSGYINDIVKALESYDIDSIKSDIDNIKQRQDIIDKQIASLGDTVNGVMDNVNNAIELFHKQIIGEVNGITADLTVFVNTQLTNYKKYVDAQDNSIRSELRYQIELLKNSIPDLTTVIVKSPYSGKLITIQEAINELWDNLRVYALTAYEYDSIVLTADEYDGFKLTALDYDYYAKERIYSDPVLYPYSPWSGERVFYQDILYKLVDLHRTSAITAQNYDDKTISANEYDLLALSAYNYDWNGDAELSGL